MLVALGGDGFLLHTMHDRLALSVPIFGMNRGTVGFLLNAYRPDGLPSVWPRQRGRLCARSPCGPSRPAVSRWTASRSTR